MGARRWAAATGLMVMAAGCAAPKPAETTPVAAPTPTPVVATPTAAEKPAVPMVALLEPFLVPASKQQIFLPPPSLGGRIEMTPPPPTPLTPAAPPQTETRPVPTQPPVTTPPPPARTAPKLSAPIVSAMVRLLEDERSRSVDQARRQLTLATNRVSQTSAEAKKTADLVRAGALAQFKSTQADTAARDAVAEQADAQKTLDDAQQRVRQARQDVETTLKALAESPFSLAQLPTTPVAFQPVPYTYRLSVLGPDAVTVRLEGGTLGRALERGHGEAGAWIVRCADPSKLRVRIGEVETQTIVRTLPATGPTVSKA